MATGAAVLFNSLGVTSTTDFSFGGGTIQVNTAGAYKYVWSISAVMPNQFALFRNGVQIPGSAFGSGAGNQQNTGSGIFRVNVGDLITLRNIDSLATLDPNAGGSQTVTDASLMLF